MNEEMKQAWLEISDMLGEPTKEEFDVFLRTWQRASQATRKALAEQPAQRTWVGLTNDEVNEFAAGCHLGNSVQGAIYQAEAKLKEKNT